MSASPTPSLPSNREYTLESLAEGQQSLRLALNVTLLMFALLTGSLFVFFLREVSIARRQISDLSLVVRDYEKSAVPLMDEFKSRLQGYAKAHPDFAPIYAKYFGPTNTASAPLPAERLAPATNPPGVRLPPAPR